MKVNGNTIKPGNVIEHKNVLWIVTKTSHVKPGKGGAFAQIELRNLFPVPRDLYAWHYCHQLSLKSQC